MSPPDRRVEGARYTIDDRAFIDAGVRYLRASGVDLDDETAGGGRIVADFAWPRRSSSPAQRSASCTSRKALPAC